MRPHITAHMIASLDGRLAALRWGWSQEAVMAIYELAAEKLAGEGWIVGSETMAEFVAVADPAARQPAPQGQRPDRIQSRAPGQGIGICFDRRARLRPTSGRVEADHLVLVLPDTVCDSHVEDLVARGVSVVFLNTGEDTGAMADALARIGAAFGTRRLLLEGGGRINAAFLAEGLIDETSTLLMPVIDGQAGVPCIYDGAQESRPAALELISVETEAEADAAGEAGGGGGPGRGWIWIRHRVLDTAVRS